MAKVEVFSKKKWNADTTNNNYNRALTAGVGKIVESS